MPAVLLSLTMLLLQNGPATAELVGFWNFDEETADDLSGNENHGIVNGAFFSDDTYSGSGLSLEITSNTHAQVPHSDSLDVDDSKTVAFWMRADNDIQ